MSPWRPSLTQPMPSTPRRPRARRGSPHLGDEISPVTSLRLPRGSARLHGPADRPSEYGDGEEARQLAAADDPWAARGLDFDISV